MADLSFDPERELSRLKQQLIQHEAELAVISAIQQALIAKLDIRSIYDAVGDKLCEIFDAQSITIYSTNLKTGMQTTEYNFEKRRKYESITVPSNSLYDYLNGLNKTFVMNGDFPQFAAKFKDYKVPQGEMPTSVVDVPVIRNEDAGIIVGVAIMDVDGGKFFSESDVRLLETIANSMSVALENARLFDETQRLLKETEERNAELAVINSVQEGLASRLDLRAIYDLVGEKIHEVFDAQDCMIAIYDKASDLLNTPFMIERGKRLPNIDPELVSEMGFRKWLIRSKETLVIDSDFEKRMMEEFGSAPMSNMTSWPLSGVIMPMLLRDEVIGIVSIYNYDRENAFIESDVRLLQTLANSMSVALENARLWEQEKLYRKALEREFEIGREIQAGFLPDSLPQPNGWEIAASLKSAREVAGDFYDVFELPDGQTGLVIADVCDKGLGAALFMTLFRSLIRAVSSIDFFARIESGDTNSSTMRLKNAISLTNNYIAETHGDTGMFATIFFGILDSNTGVLTYINGGHLPPLIINAYGVKEVLKFSGPAVGAIANADYVIKEVIIEPGESFFAYTDGLTDTANHMGEFFSKKELIPLLINGQPLSPLLAQIQRRVEDHAAGIKQFDDITMLALRRM